MTRALEGGTAGPAMFALLLRLLSTHFDRAGTGASYAKLKEFVVSHRTPFRYFIREVQVVAPVAKGTVRVLAPEVEVGFEVVRMAVIEEYLIFMSTPDPVVLATYDTEAVRNLGLHVVGVSDSWKW